MAAVQLAGGWKSTSMIMHYSAPLGAERGAVAQCFADVDPAGAAGRPAAQIVQFEALAGTVRLTVRGPNDHRRLGQAAT